VRAAKRGDAAAWKSWSTALERKICRLTMNITPRIAKTPNDCHAGCFFSSPRTFEGLPGGFAFLYLLVRIAANEALMRLRKRRPISSRWTSRSKAMRFDAA